MRKLSFDEKLKQLRSVADEPLSVEVTDVIRDALNGTSGVLASVAAGIVGERRITELAPDLVRSFNRFMTETDKGCQGKTAIVDALVRLEYPADDVFLAGIKHVQMEPAFGGRADTAGDLRAACAVALASIRHPEAAFELTNLLVDPQRNARRAAVKSLAHIGGVEAELVIRLKALVGDSDPDVMGECFTGLITLSPVSSVSFIGKFLESEDLEVAEQAALALGQSHTAEAFEILREQWEYNISPEFRRMLLLPISLLRRDDALEFLLEVINDSGSKLAAYAVSVMGVYADENSVKKIRDTVKRKHDPLVTEAFEREIGSL